MACRDFGSKYPEMLLDYKVPNIFPENLFGDLGETQDMPIFLLSCPSTIASPTHRFSYVSIEDCLVMGAKSSTLQEKGSRRSDGL